MNRIATTRMVLTTVAVTLALFSILMDIAVMVCKFENKGMGFPNENKGNKVFASHGESKGMWDKGMGSLVKTRVCTSHVGTKVSVKYAVQRYLWSFQLF